MVTKPNTKATIRDKRLIKQILDNPSQSLKDSMVNSGYSISTANNPSIVLKKPSFIELMEKAGITDEYLNSRLKDGLESTKLLIHGSEVLEPPDNIARHKYLETALKVKGHLNNSTNVLVQSNDYKVFITED